jgi:hypothetical protein
MFAFLRAVAVLPVILLASTIQLHAQDMPVRVEAVRLMERANDVSLAAHLMPTTNWRALSAPTAWTDPFKTARSILFIPWIANVTK